MEKIHRVLKTVPVLIDVLLWILSPFAIILFIIVGFVGTIYGLTQRELIRRLDTEGQVEVGFVDFYAEDMRLLFIDHDEAGTRYFGSLKTLCYPDELINSFQEGDEVAIRYLPGRSEDLVLEEHMHYFRACPGFDPEYFYVLGVCVVLVIIHPEFLYFGYINDDSFQLFPEWPQ